MLPDPVQGLTRRHGDVEKHLAAVPRNEVYFTHALLEQPRQLLENDVSGLVPVLEAHAGKVLSARNKALVQDALVALQALLDAAEPPDDSQALTADLERMSRAKPPTCWTSRRPLRTQCASVGCSPPSASQTARQGS